MGKLFCYNNICKVEKAIRQGRGADKVLLQ